MDLGTFAPYLSAMEIILATALIVLVLMQAKGSDLGSFIGGGDSGGGYRTRRGIDATLHRVTIACAIAFFVCTFLTFIALGSVG